MRNMRALCRLQVWVHKDVCQLLGASGPALQFTLINAYFCVSSLFVFCIRAPWGCLAYFPKRTVFLLTSAWVSWCELNPLPVFAGVLRAPTLWQSWASQGWQFPGVFAVLACQWFTWMEKQSKVRVWTSRKPLGSDSSLVDKMYNLVFGWEEAFLRAWCSLDLSCVALSLVTAISQTLQEVAIPNFM